jgi:hypothetical protein
MPPDGDICEACGAWLLEGQCPFCYASLPDGARFCGECGNPATGVTCPSCGTVSIFDYCPNCYTRLTEAAAESLAALQATPEAQEFFQAAQEVEAVQAELLAIQAEADAEERNEREQSPQDEETRKTLEQLQQVAQRRAARKRAPGTPEAGSHEEQAAARKQAALQERQEQRRKERDARREERKKRMEELRARFTRSKKRVETPPAPPEALTTNQEIRRYFMAVRPPNAAGWLCNAYNVIHPDPLHCTKPTAGGKWIMEIPPNLPIAPENT